jgi:hypothetical protein
VVARKTIAIGQAIHVLGRFVRASWRLLLHRHALLSPADFVGVRVLERLAERHAR